MVVDLRRCGGGGGGEEVLWKAAYRRPTSRRCDPASRPLGCVPPLTHTAGRRLRPDTGLGCKSDGRERRVFCRQLVSLQVPKATRKFRN